MTIFHSMNTTSSALTAQRLRMDVISSNMANMETTRARQVNGEWEPYRRKSVVLEPKQNEFSALFQQAVSNQNGKTGNGVRVAKIVEDKNAPLKQIYDPSHPDANEEGYVQMPNVDPLKEMVDLMSATRSYEANVTVFNASKSMMMKALEIGK
ncbi:flagellar basal body rod protein FlgC [Bacillus thermotolerans]|uniref:Flagellar basal-body rod protein FlgC n=1 Tax=Bacillus thermotolerans TaxID=1221996 RepID=A0A0F5IA74_BACTR|nr:flagellar basal body rod protein FlgC [Bacillus thermotolerans]KKB42353.1 Flagellar basal-body rod protein FlgC [Bacillus thermotolerans]